MRLGIEQLTVLGLKPLEFVGVAADLGCECISTGLSGMPGYPPFSLREGRRFALATAFERSVSRVGVPSLSTLTRRSRSLARRIP